MSNDAIDYKKLSDEELLQAWRDGDAPAGTEFYGRYYYKIDSLILRWVRNEQMAQELTQDVFRSAAKDQMLPRSTEKYLVTIAKRKAIDILKGKWGRIERYTVALEQEEQHQSTPANTDTRLASRDDLKRIVSGLSIRDYDLLMMAAEIPIAEIAKLRGKSEYAIKFEIHQARRRAQALTYPGDAFSDYELLMLVAKNVPHAEIADALAIPESAVQHRIDEARMRAGVSDRVLLMMAEENVPPAKIADALGIPQAAVHRRIEQARGRASAPRQGR